MTAPRTSRQWGIRFSANPDAVLLVYDDKEDAVSHARAHRRAGATCEVVYRVVTQTRWISPKEDEDP